MNNDLISREDIRKRLNEAFDCENATKYGNKDAEQQAHSYSTLMLYEISNIVEDCIDNAPTVEPCYQTTSCLDCKNYDKDNYYCPRFCEVIREIAKENQRPQDESVDISKLRLMTVEECAGHTIDYAMGWKACIEWIKKGGAE